MSEVWRRAIARPHILEGVACVVPTAVFLGVYLYGWDRISPRAHLAAGWAVAVSGMLSAVFVVIANAWMNSPTGFRWVDGRAVDIDPIAAMLNPAAFSQVIHMTLAAYASTGLVVAGIHALPLLRQPRNAFHRRALSVALLIGAPTALLQPLAVDQSARFVAHYRTLRRCLFLLLSCRWGLRSANPPFRAWCRPGCPSGSVAASPSTPTAFSWARSSRRRSPYRS